MSASDSASPLRIAVEVVIPLALIFLIIAWSLQILSPFVSLVAWGAIIAVSVYPLFTRLRGALGGRGKLAVVMVVVTGLALVIVPAWLFGGSLIDSAKSFHADVASGNFEMRPPPDGVRDWPVVGERVYSNWADAAANFEGWLEAHHEQLRDVAQKVLAQARNIGIGVAQFVLSILLAGALLAHADSVRAGMLSFCRRLAGHRGDEMLDLAVQTIRSVTVGVLGIAFIQALLVGIGMFVVDVPLTGVWTLVALILCVAQVPLLLLMVPIIIYVFSYESTTVASVFAIYSVVVSMSDMALKPLMLGRGVNVPMLVVLLGAIGGLIVSGIMGLFVGAVVLALAWTLLQGWLAQDKLHAGATDAATD